MLAIAGNHVVEDAEVRGHRLGDAQIAAVASTRRRPSLLFIEESSTCGRYGRKPGPAERGLRPRLLKWAFPPASQLERRNTCTGRLREKQQRFPQRIGGDQRAVHVHAQRRRRPAESASAWNDLWFQLVMSRTSVMRHVFKSDGRYARAYLTPHGLKHPCHVKLVSFR